jgi:peptide/nickel transport system permease protein
MTASSLPNTPAPGFSTADAAADSARGGGSYQPLAAPTPEPTPGRRSLLGQALHDTFVRAGARAGAVWIGLVAVLGVLAPFLANSHPLLMKSGGRVTSPLISSLDPVDVGLVVYAVFAAGIAFRRSLNATDKVKALAWPLLALAAVVLAWHFGWRLVTFRVYRPDWLAAGGWAAGGWGRRLWVVAVNLAALAAALAAFGAVAAMTVGYFRSALAPPSPDDAAVAEERARARRSAAIVSLLAALVLAVVAVTVHGPANVVYERFREMEKAGQVQWAVRTIVPYSPNDRLRDRPEEVLRPPSRAHWLGTTMFGEDMLSRMLHACRVALAIGFIATGISTFIGVVVGGVMGYYAGWADLLGMRAVEIIEAIPRLILLLIVTVFFGRSLYLMMVVIGLVSWTGDARFIRAEFLKLRKLDFVQAAVAAGLGRWSIIFRHMLPNGVAPVLVNASFGIAGAILLESTLSFLGLGLGPEDPSWGQLLNQARQGGTGFNWWIATFPGLAIFLTVFSYILIGEAMRDAIDPRLQKRD